MIHDGGSKRTEHAEPRTAVWYFVAATFAFVLPSLVFRGAGPPWLPFVTLGLGFVLVIAGGIVFAEVVRQRAATGTSQPRGPSSGDGQID